MYICVYIYACVHTCTHTHPIDPIFFSPKALICKLCWCSRRTLVSPFQIPWCGAFLALPVQCVSLFILSLAWQLEEGKRWGPEDRKLSIPDSSTQAPRWRLLPPGSFQGNSLASIPRAQWTVRKVRLYFMVVGEVHVPPRAALVKGKNDYPSLFFSSSLSYQKCFFNH